MAAHTDDGFHEIQLNGKQLVFLFMAATVVSVVIFLCGVLVGRGVRAARVESSEMAALSTGEPAPQPAAAPAGSTPAGSDPTAAAAPPTVDELSYFNRLQGSTPTAEVLKPQAAAPAVEEPARPASRPAATPAVASTPARTTDRAATPAAATPGFTVQIAALNVRTEADAIAERLSSKGYDAYVVSPPGGTPQIFRVRVGKFGSRREAETVAAKLEKEEQFKPWITR